MTANAPPAPKKDYVFCVRMPAALAAALPGAAKVHGFETPSQMLRAVLELVVAEAKKEKP